MKLKFLTIGLALGLASSLARADFTPIPLDPTSFNADPVIEKTAPRSVNDFVTVTLDQGTNKNANTWYEIGYNTNNPTTGIPAHGSIVTATASATHTYQMPPDYHTNCCLFIGHNNSAWTPIMGPATFTLSTPAPFTALSFLNASGNGACTIKYVVHYADNSTEEGTFSSTDWWSANTAGRVFDAAGLVGMNGGVNNLSANHGGGFYNDVTLANTTVNVTSVDFYWVYGSSNGHSPWGNGRTAILALSGSTDGTTFNPVAVTGYNQDIVVEADAPHTIGSGSALLTGSLTNDNTYCTFTMDGGIYKNNWTWYEQGYYAAYPNSGLPVAGSTISSATQPNVHYTLPSTYVGNCAVCLSSNLPSAQIKFATPTSAGGLSMLAAGGNNGTRLNIRVEIQFQDGSSETNWVSMFDWFDRGSPYAHVTFGQTAPDRMAVRNTADQFGNPFEGMQPFNRDPRLNGALNPNVPIVRLYDLMLPVTNSTGLITSINLVTTNTGMWNQTAAFFAVSGASAPGPFITQPASYVTDSTSGVTNSTTGGAVANDVRFTKGYQGINNINLWVSNRLGNPLTYQWMKAPRGGGFQDVFNKFNMSTFVNVSGPNIGGATSPNLVISNATLADTGDYVVVAASPSASYTSFVATVTVLNTNNSILVGQGFGDTMTKWSTDGTSGNGQETFVQASDQAEQKWLSTGLGGLGLDGTAIAQGTQPFVGPVGYTVTPVNGASIVNAIRFYSANDGTGRDPRDYLLEGSNDGNNWAVINGGQLLGTLMLPVARGGTGSTPCNPATQPLTEVDFPNATAYKQYRLTITNCVEPIATPLMQVAEIQLVGTLIPNPPVWVRQPVPTVTVFAGAAPTWGVLAGGYPAPKFQWYRNGTLIPNATNSTYTLTNAQLTDSGAQFSVVASNTGGNLTSSSSTLNVIAAPTESYPSAVLANGPMAYWRLNEGPDNTLGNNGVVAHDYAGGHNGYYSNVVIGVAGYNPVSDPDTATRFGDSPTDSLVQNIEDVTFARGTNTAGAAFSIEAWVYGGNQTVDAAIVAKGNNGGLAVGTGTGTEQFALDVAGNPRKFRFLVRDFFGNGYQAVSSITPADPASLQPVWHHLVGVCDQPNGKVSLYVDGLLAASGTIPSGVGILSQPAPVTIGARASTAAAASYDNQWAGTIDEVAVYPLAMSGSQVLTHFYAAQHGPLITLQPVSATTADNVSVTFTSLAYGPAPLSYQWYHSDGNNPTTAYAGQTSSNLTFTTSPTLNSTYYQLVVTNNYGAVTSAVAQLTVISGIPSFLVDLPSSGTFYLGHIIQLHVSPGGTAPFTYQWQKDNVALADNYRISGSQSDTLTIAYAALSDSGSYKVIVSNGQGSTPSTVDAITVTSNSTSFFNAGSSALEWSLQGTTPPILGNNTLQLTANLGSTARTAFLNAKQNIGTFNVSFVYQDVTGAGGADGVTFCIQNQAATALGGAGGALGYGGITPSWALALNIYSGQTRGINFLTAGALVIPFVPILPVDLGNNTDPIRVDLNYNGTVLTAKFTDITTSATFTTNETVNIPGIVGGSTAFVGFTGADGGVAATQTVSWSAPAPTAFKLNAQTVGANLVLSWPASAGAYLLTSSTLTNPTWSNDVTDQFQLVGSQAQVTVTPKTGAQYFRLQILP